MSKVVKSSLSKLKIAMTGSDISIVCPMCAHVKAETMKSRTGSFLIIAIAFCENRNNTFVRSERKVKILPINEL
ncbi:MAG: hypothetical protein ACI86L_001652 [Dokdonia sp.]